MTRPHMSRFTAVGLIVSTAQRIGARQLNQLNHHHRTLGPFSYAASGARQVHHGEATTAQTANASLPGAWPDFKVSITWPLNGTRVIGDNVPIKALVTAGLADVTAYAESCRIVYSDVRAGEGEVSTSHPLGHKPASTDPYVLYPAEYEAMPVCVGGDGVMKICRMPSRVSGARRTWVRVECVDHVNPMTTSTLAAALVDYHVTVQSHIDSIDEHPGVASLPLSRVGPSGNQELVYIDVDYGRNSEEEARKFCSNQAWQQDLAACVDFMRQAVEQHRDTRYHAYVGALMLWLHSRGVDLSTIEGTTYAATQKLQAMMAIVESRRPKRVCEIGFNAGHSALLWLLYGGNDTSVLAFDLGEHSYSHLAVEWIVERMGPRLTVVMGTSVHTVPAYAEMHWGEGQKCDLIFVDGGHEGEVPLLDMTNMMALANRTDHVVLVDDASADDVWSAVDAMTESGNFQVYRHHKSLMAPVFQHVEGGLWYTWQTAHGDCYMAEGKYTWPVSG